MEEAFPGQWEHGVRGIRVPQAAGDIRTAHRQCVSFTPHYKPPLTSQPSEKNTIQLNNALKDATLIKMS